MTGEGGATGADTGADTGAGAGGAVRDGLPRAVDVVVAGALLVAAAPVLAAAAAAVRLLDGAPAVFRQERAGLGGRPFTIYKLRTMGPPSGPHAGAGAGSGTVGAVRVTRLGALLRACSLDEVPQLVNVLRGDMALVGPRPLYLEYVPLYSAEQALRLAVRPGLTGLAQVSGRNTLGWTERLALDVAYVRSRSPRLDLSVLARTVPAVLVRSGVLEPGGETWFTGDAAQVVS